MINTIGERGVLGYTDYSLSDIIIALYFCGSSNSPCDICPLKNNCEQLYDIAIYWLIRLNEKAIEKEIR